MPKRSSRRPYSQGEVNRLTDSLLHPLAKEDKRILLLDAFIHGLIEKNPPASVRKFLRYTLPDLVAQTQKDQKTNHLTRQAVKLLGELTTPEKRSKRRARKTQP